MHAQAAEEERHSLQQRFVEASGKSAGLESQLRQLEARCEYHPLSAMCLLWGQPCKPFLSASPHA